MGGRSEEELVRLARVGLPRSAAGLPQCADELVAGCLAAPASFCAQAAVLVHLGVFLAFLGTGSACLSAGLQHHTDHVFVLPGETSQDPTSCQANIGTILVCADARHQVTSHRFTETSISARRAGLGTFKTRCNTRRELLLIDSEISLGMSLKHGPHVRHDVPLVAVGRLPRTSAGTAPVDMRLLLLPAFLNPRRSCK